MPSITPPIKGPVFSGASEDDILAGSIFRGNHERVARLFYAEHGRPPLIVWSPNRFDLGSHVFEQFLRYCWGLPTHAGLPLSPSFDADHAPHPEWLMLLEVEGFGRDFRYLRYGQGIVDYYGKDMRGARTSDLGGHITRYFTALYRAAMQRRQVVLSEHEPPASVFVRVWRRLIVPLVDAERYVTHFAVMNLPENHLRAGLEVVPFPCVVADEGRIVRFANDAARALHPAPDFHEHGTSLDEFFGFALELPESPRALLEPVPSRLRLDVPAPLRRDRDGPGAITVCATRYRDRPLYVVTASEPSPA